MELSICHDEDGFFKHPMNQTIRRLYSDSSVFFGDLLVMATDQIGKDVDVSDKQIATLRSLYP
jgi:hypothetical protein